MQQQSRARWMLDEIRDALASAGFVEDPTNGILGRLSVSFLGPTTGSWQVSATAVPLGQVIDTVEFGIAPTGENGAWRGTQHRVLNQSALVCDVRRIVDELQELAANESRMQCPKCCKRWVTLKEHQGRAFLSCEGMRKARGRSGKYTVCDGVTRAIPALIVHQ